MNDEEEIVWRKLKYDQKLL